MARLEYVDYVRPDKNYTKEVSSKVILKSIEVLLNDTCLSATAILEYVVPPNGADRALYQIRKDNCQTLAEWRFFFDHPSDSRKGFIPDKGFIPVNLVEPSPVAEVYSLQNMEEDISQAEAQFYDGLISETEYLVKMQEFLSRRAAQITHNLKAEIKLLKPVL